MFDAANFTGQLDEQIAPEAIDVRGHLHRIKSDYRFRREIRSEMLGTLMSVLSTRPRGNR